MAAIIVKLFVSALILVLNSCLNTAKKSNNEDIKVTIYPSDVIPLLLI
ncbi:hypothetical protein SAMN03080602_00424 [Arenibacter troitsensis]|uniref:Uncharacterized protein n=1 Tax=Arenibacter troitsensis TaxID=188872 RepID=A0A1X7I682_9FLAO|nr:hypothetical protein SAMN03080602_00424 [Arenibacter troitsensis]